MRDLIRRGYRPVTMPRAMADAVLKTLLFDTSARTIFGDMGDVSVRNFVESLEAALATHGDPVEFWCTNLQQVHVGSALGQAWVHRKYPDGVERDVIREAEDILRKAWTWPVRPEDRIEINRGTATSTDVPEPTPERLAECGFRDVEHLERFFRRDRIAIYSFADRSEMETYYLRGWCSVLAMAVHRRTGWPLVGVFDPWELGYPYHVACQAPDGTYVDARGVGLSKDELSAPFQRWPDCPLDVRGMTAEHVLSRFPLHPHYHDLAENEHLDILLPDLEAETSLRP